jgi:hypothetical protein
MTELSLVALSLQRALLDAVTPNLRGVVFSLDQNILKISWFFDGPPSEDDRDRLSVVETEVVADCPADLQLASEVMALDATQRLPDVPGRWVYRRYEPVAT